MQTVARVGMVVVAKTLSDRLLQRANTEFFAPRGLRVRICKTAAMRQLVGLSTEPEKSKLAKAGHVAETIVLHLPIVRKVYNRLAPPPPPAVSFDPNIPSTLAQRRIASLEGHSLPLDFDIPPAAPPEKIMQKAQGMSVRLEQWQQRSSEAKANQSRQLLAIAEGRATSLPPRPPSNSSNPLTQAWEFRQARRQRKKEWKARMAGFSDKKMRRLQNKAMLEDRKELNATENLLWLVLLNAEQGEHFSGWRFLQKLNLIFFVQMRRFKARKFSMTPRRLKRFPKTNGERNSKKKPRMKK